MPVVIHYHPSCSRKERALSYAYTHAVYASKLLWPNQLCYDWGFRYGPSDVFPRVARMIQQQWHLAWSTCILMTTSSWFVDHASIILPAVEAAGEVISFKSCMYYDAKNRGQMCFISSVGWGVGLTPKPC